MLPNNALDWLTHYRQQKITNITPLVGLTGGSQLITLANDEHYVLRRQTSRLVNLGVNYQQEATLLNWISPLNFAPKPIYKDQQSTLLTWFEGTAPTEYSTHLLISLAQQLARLHQFPYPQAVNHQQTFTHSFPSLELSERLTFLWSALSAQKRQDLGFSPPFPSIVPFQRAICHHDIHLGNLIQQQDQLCLIDWEYAAISDPALDIALLLQANVLSMAEQSLFLRHYFEQMKLTGRRQKLFHQKMAEYAPAIFQLNQLWFAL